MKHTDKSVVQLYVPMRFDIDHNEVRVRELDWGNRVILWNLRRWVLARSNGERIPPRSNGLTDTTEASEVIDEFMTLLSATTMRGVCIHCIHTESVSSDELLLLRTVRSVQADAIDDARRTIARIIPTPLGAAFIRTVQALVDCMDHSGLKLNPISHLKVV